ncbi:MAG: Asp-tRNA(Asn)/Glu-tRNA(Gln) amidotransferase GatCAB subunit C [Thiotrichales bacterium]|nr:Asp-tRNA(Asn)/Glu-tRNA(Gln) amidotransferase GatCAB subunit C [Thiotrichales bacterium]|tara:strand:+ start:584 stop:865 length:282 start_codon:yes stop_codon:yes gene_type:complete
MNGNEIRKIAHLARLAVHDDELKHYARELTHILSLVEQMNAVSTDGVTPMAHPLNMIQRLREDSITEPDKREELQSVAPQVSDGLYLVPKVIE